MSDKPKYHKWPLPFPMSNKAIELIFFDQTAMESYLAEFRNRNKTLLERLREIEATREANKSGIQIMAHFKGQTYE